MRTPDVRPFHWIPLFLAGCLWGAVANAGDDAPATVTVKRGPLPGVVEVKGLLVPVRFETVAPEPDAWRGKLEVLEAAAEGPVVEGQTLMRFVDEDYRQELRAKDRALELARIDLDQKARGFALLKSGWSRDRNGWARSLEGAKRDKQYADQALERFVTVERKLKDQDDEYAMEGRRISIQNMREELQQLEKMYKEDDLTEETEEIVLNRNRRNMERMLASFERFKLRWEYDRTIDRPREHERLVEAAERAATNLAWMESTGPQELRQAEIALEKAREDYAKAEVELGDLRTDEAIFTLTAPMRGYAVRGQLDGGTWKNLGKDEAYEVGATVGARQVVYTIVDEAEMRVHTSVKEADLADIVVGQAASFTTALTGKDALEASVGAVARYGSGGTYEVILRVTTKNERLRAGLACEAKIVRAAGPEVLSVPVGCLRQTDGVWHVWVVTDEGPQQTAVEVGRKEGDRMELTSGVTAGQVVLATPPKPEK